MLGVSDCALFGGSPPVSDHDSCASLIGRSARASQRMGGTARYAPRHPARVLVVPKHHTADKTLPGPAQWKRPVYLFEGWAKIASDLSTSEFSTLLFDIAISVVFAMPLWKRQGRNFIFT